jgi:hypothetical protein
MYESREIKENYGITITIYDAAGETTTTFKKAQKRLN